MPTFTIAKLLAHALYLNEVKRIYGIIGTSILDFLDALYDYRNEINFITTRHEQVAVSAADGEARVTGRIGVAAVHAGPGFLNSLISLSIAMKDRVPVLLITGGVRRRLKGTDAWLEIDQENVGKSLSKGYYRINRANEALDMIKDAFKTLLSKPKGPVIIEVPEDAWNEKISINEKDIENLKTSEEKIGIPKIEDIREIASRMKKAKRPLILACGELTMNKDFKPEILKEVLERTGSYLITSGNGRGAISEEENRNLGRSGYGGGNLIADNALENCDFLLVLGNEFDDTTTYAYTLLPSGEVFVISLDEAVKKRPAYYEHINYDPLLFLEALNNELNEQRMRKEDWDNMINEFRKRWKAALEEAINRRFEKSVNASRFFSMLNKALPRKRILTGGQGVHILYTYDFIEIIEPRTFLAATNLGAMGYAFPASIGAKIAKMDYEVISVVGDGDFMMTVQDLETLKRENIPLKIIVVNDNSYRVLYQRQIIQKQKRIYETLLTNPDFVQLANSFGIKAMRIENDEEISSAIDKFVSSKEAFLLELVTDPNDLPPLNIKQTLEMSM